MDEEKCPSEENEIRRTQCRVLYWCVHHRFTSFIIRKKRCITNKLFIDFLIFISFIYFFNLGSKAVDALMDSEWSRKKGEKEPFFSSRLDVVNFLNK